jgi:t-SNARE complex subunit (syntaxin)
MNDIDTLHRHTLASVDSEEASRFSKKIEASSTLAASEAQNIRRLLKSIDQETKNKTSNLSPSDMRLRTSKHTLWCKKFMAQMEHFERMQATYRNKYRAHLERQYLLVKPEATRSELDELASDHSNQLMNQQVSRIGKEQRDFTNYCGKIFKMANRAQVQKTLDEMKERHLEIQVIERSMSELHQMFLDVAFIVAQQGSTIDKVDEYVQTSLEATAQAAQEITNAVVKQKRAQRRRWILSGIGLFILIVLIVSIVLALTNRL